MSTPSLTPDLQAALARIMQGSAPVQPQAPIPMVQPPPVSVQGPVATPPQVPVANPTPNALVAPEQAPDLPVQARQDDPSGTGRPGKLKSFLTDFLYGAGQGLVNHAGLTTDYQKQQDAAKLGIQQQSADDLSYLRGSQADRLQQQTATLATQNAPYTFEKDDQSIPEQFRGQTMTTAAAQALKTVFAKGLNAQGIQDTKGDQALALEQLRQNGGNPKDHQIISSNGRRLMVSKRDGSLIKDLGADTAMITGPRNAVARAQANAAYGVSNVMDENGDPMAISRLTQLQTGTPTMSETQTQNLAGDKLGAATYMAANRTVHRLLPVLDDMGQRAIIARATEEVERNPGAIDSVISAATQQGLSPEGAQLIASMKQMNEFGSAFKKYTGNSGAATDSLRQVIHSNQPSTQNSKAVNERLLEQDLNLATGVMKNLGRPGRYAAPARGGSTPAAPPTPSGDSFFHPMSK